MVDGVLEGAEPAKIPDVRLVPIVEAELCGRAAVDIVGELAEEQGLSEGRREIAVVVPKPDRIEGGERSGRGEGIPGVDSHEGVTILVVALVRPEEEQAVLDQRAADAHVREVSRVVRFAKGLGLADRILRHEVFILVAEGHVA